MSTPWTCRSDRANLTFDSTSMRACVSTAPTTTGEHLSSIGSRKQQSGAYANESSKRHQRMSPVGLVKETSTLIGRPWA